MKIKLYLKSFAILGAVATILRCLQYAFVIGKDGYFVTGDILSKILAGSVYAVLAIAAILALVVLFQKPKVQADYDELAQADSIGYLFIGVAALLMVLSGIFVSSASLNVHFPIDHTQIPNVLKLLLCLFGILSAVYFALLGVKQLSEKETKVPTILGLFVPIFFALLGVYEFFVSLNRAGQSNTKLFMVTTCAIALFTMSLSLAFCKAEVFRARVISCVGILAVATSATGLPFVIATLFGRAAFDTVLFVQALIHILFTVVAYVVLIRLIYSKYQPKYEPEPIKDEPLDKFLNEIPDQDGGNDE